MATRTGIVDPVMKPKTPDLNTGEKIIFGLKVVLTLIAKVNGG